MTASKDSFMGFESQLKELIGNNPLPFQVKTTPEFAKTLAEWIEDSDKLLKDVPPETSEEVKAFVASTILLVVYMTEIGLLRSSGRLLELASKADSILKAN